MNTGSTQNASIERLNSNKPILG